MSNQTLGQLGENTAVKFLKQQGYRIVERNFQTPFGEIDIIAIDDDTLVYVEVKTRSSNAIGVPEEAVDSRKLQHLLKAASYYKSIKKDLPEGERVDVVAIETNTGRVDLIKNVTG